MKIEILGMGCPKCKKLYENVREALANTGKEAEVIKVEEIGKITQAGVMFTPALMIDGKIKASGKVLTAREIEQMLR